MKRTEAPQMSSWAIRSSMTQHSQSKPLMMNNTGCCCWIVVELSSWRRRSRQSSLTQLTCTHTRGSNHPTAQLRERVRPPPPKSSSEHRDAGWWREKWKGESGGEKTCLSLSLSQRPEKGALLRAPPHSPKWRTHTQEKKGRQKRERERELWEALPLLSGLYSDQRHATGDERNTVMAAVDLYPSHTYFQMVAQTFYAFHESNISSRTL